VGRRDHERTDQEPTSAADKRAGLLARLYRAPDRWPRMNPQELRHLERLVADLPPDDRSYVLLRAFVAPPANGYLAQQYAGELLTRLRPPCSSPLTDLLRSVLPNWDRSASGGRASSQGLGDHLAQQLSLRTCRHVPGVL
jgi:hypothetical protein